MGTMVIESLPPEKNTKRETYISPSYLPNHAYHTRLIIPILYIKNTYIVK